MIYGPAYFAKKNPGLLATVGEKLVEGVGLGIGSQIAAHGYSAVTGFGRRRNPADPWWHEIYNQAQYDEHFRSFMERIAAAAKSDKKLADKALKRLVREAAKKIETRYRRKLFTSADRKRAYEELRKDLVREFAVRRPKSNPGRRACGFCGKDATHHFEGAGEDVCMPCAESAMEHGHRHVHDSAEDCVAELERLDGSGTDTIACAEPRTEEQWDNPSTPGNPRARTWRPYESANTGLYREKVERLKRKKKLTYNDAAVLISHTASRLGYEVSTSGRNVYVDERGHRPSGMRRIVITPQSIHRSERGAKWTRSMNLPDRRQWAKDEDLTARFLVCFFDGGPRVLNPKLLVINPGGNVEALVRFIENHEGQKMSAKRRKVLAKGAAEFETFHGRAATPDDLIQVRAIKGSGPFLVGIGEALNSDYKVPASWDSARRGNWTHEGGDHGRQKKTRTPHWAAIPGSKAPPVLVEPPGAQTYFKPTHGMMG